MKKNSVSSAFAFKICKKCQFDFKNFFFRKYNIGINRRRINADFESVKKVAQQLMRKSYQRKSDRKIEFLT